MANTKIDASNGSGRAGAIGRLISLGEKYSQIMLVCGLLLICMIYSVNQTAGLGLAGLTLLMLLTNRI